MRRAGKFGRAFVFQHYGEVAAASRRPLADLLKPVEEYFAKNSDPLERMRAIKVTR